MFDQQSQIEVTLRYTEYRSMQEGLNNLSKDNQKLRAVAATLKEQLEKQNKLTAMFKQSEQRVKVLSKNMIKISKKILQYEEYNKQNDQEQKIIQYNLKYSLHQQEKIQQIQTQSQPFKHKIQFLENQAKIKNQEMATIMHNSSSTNLQLNQSIRLLKNKCASLQQQVHKRDVNARIIVDQREDEFIELKEKADAVFAQNMSLKKRIQDCANKLEFYSPIVKKYWDEMDDPESMLFSNYENLLKKQIFSVKKGSNFENISLHLKTKRQAIDKLLKKRFEKIITQQQKNIYNSLTKSAQ